jgi:nucleotide-binding universal stress UspA family protein
MLQTSKTSRLRTFKRLPIRSILVATELAASSNKPAQHAIEIAGKYGATLHFLYVVSSLGYMLCGPEVAEQARQIASRDMDGFHTQLVCRGALKKVEGRFSVRPGDIAEQIEEFAREEHVDLVVVGTDCAEGFSRLVFGSAGERIFRSIESPVLTVNVKAKRPVLNTKGVDHILFATDFGSGSMLAFSYALSIAVQFKATLAMLHVISPRNRKQISNSKLLFHDSLQRLQALPLPEGSVETLPLVECGDVSERILQTADALSADLIVMGLKRSRYPGLAARLPGSLAHRIIRDAQCPVLTVRG